MTIPLCNHSLLFRVTLGVILSYLIVGSAISDPIGMRVGVSYSGYHGEGYSELDKSPKILPAFGLFMQKNLSRNFIIQAELVYSKKGTNRTYRINNLGDYYTFYESVSVTYLDLPILLNMRFPSRGTRSVGVFLGPRISYLISDNRSGSYTNNNPNISDGSFDGSITNLRKLTVGITTGFDYTIQMGGRDVVLDFRYAMDLNQAAKDELYNDVVVGELPLMDYQRGLPEDWRNGVFSLTFGIYLTK